MVNYRIFYWESGTAKHSWSLLKKHNTQPKTQSPKNQIKNRPQGAHDSKLGSASAYLEQGIIIPIIIIFQFFQASSVYAQGKSSDINLAIGVNMPSLILKTTYNKYGPDSFTSKCSLGYSMGLDYRLDVNEIKSRIAFGINLESFNFSIISKTIAPNANSTEENLDFSTLYLGIPITFFKTLVKSNNIQINAFLSPMVSFSLSKSALGVITSNNRIYYTDSTGNTYVKYQTVLSHINESQSKYISNNYLSLRVGLNCNYYFTKKLGVDLSISYGFMTRIYVSDDTKMNSLSLKLGILFDLSKTHYTPKESKTE